MTHRVAVSKKAAIWRKIEREFVFPRICFNCEQKQTVCELVQIKPFLIQSLSSVQLSKINFRLHLSQNI